MAKVKPPEWGAEVHRILFQLKMPKTKLATLIGVNYTEMCNVISGNKVNPKVQKLIIDKIQELKLKDFDLEA